jgi:tRNA threonylcarbamoyladenosine modification (KEOPS) complex Cgi121 subunit
MQIFAVSINSAFDFKMLDKLNAVLISRNHVKSVKELQLAEYLSRRAFQTNSSIAKKFKYEFLLWLAGKRDIQCAVDETRPDSNECLLIIFSGSAKHIFDQTSAKKQHLTLEIGIDPLRLEKISLSRIK